MLSPYRVWLHYYCYSFLTWVEHNNDFKARCCSYTPYLIRLSLSIKLSANCIIELPDSFSRKLFPSTFKLEVPGLCTCSSVSLELNVWSNVRFGFIKVSCSENCGPQFSGMCPHISSLTFYFIISSADEDQLLTLRRMLLLLKRTACRILQFYKKRNCAIKGQA